MDLVQLKQLLTAGMTIWIIVGGALLALLVETIWPQKGSKGVFVVGVVTLLAALKIAFDQWLLVKKVSSDLLLVDQLTLFFIFLVVFITLISLLNLYAYLKAHEKISGELVILMLFALVGMIFLFASDHLIVNFIGLETMSLAVYVMVGSNKRDLRSNEAAIKYYIMGSVASAVLLYGIALLYGSFGTFKLSELAAVQVYPNLVYLPRIALTLLLTGFLFKIAVVPFHFWVADVYQGAPTPVTGFMATGVKVSALAFFIRVLMALNFLPDGFSQKLLLASVIMTLLVGNLMAIVQDNLKRVLAFSSVSHAGFLLMGLYVGFENGKFQPEAAGAVLFYLVAYTLMSLGAFAVLSIMVDEKREATELTDLQGLGSERPALAMVFSLFMISLMGLPPTAGFTAKYGIISLAVKQGHVSLALFAVMMSLVSAYYYLRPLMMMYFKEVPTRKPAFMNRPIPFFLMFAVVFSAVAVIYLGLQPDNYLHMTTLAVKGLK